MKLSKIVQSLTEVTLPDGLESIYDRTFEYCRSLTSITIPGSVGTIESYAFNGAGLTSVTIENGVQGIDYNAFRLTKLTSVTLPPSIEGLGSRVFDYCLDLTTITVQATTPPILQEGTLGNGLNNLTKIRVPAASVAAYQAAWSNYAHLIEGY